MTRSWTVFILALFAAAGPAGAAGQAVPAPSRDQLPLQIFFRGTPVGNEQVVVERTSEGWTVSSTGRQSSPLDITLRLAELKYRDDWTPRSLLMQGTLREVGFDVRVTLGEGQADVIASQGTNSTTKQDKVTPGAILLPNNVYGSYVALGRRLITLATGTRFRTYVAPQAEIDATLKSVETDRLRTTERSFDLRKHVVTFQNPGGALDVDVWTEADGRLVHVGIPMVGLEVTRQDVAAVSTRREKTPREGDEEVNILSNGFNLSATVSRPTPTAGGTPPKRWPAVILVAGSGAQDRDEFVAGIPVFAQLAVALADGGYMVVRYDKRGVGQSGGRFESATLSDYADDVVAVIKYMSKRKDVDKRRIAIVGHSEGAWVGLVAADRHDDVWKVVLAAGPGLPGDELVLEQQRYVLEKLGSPAPEIEAKVALQKRINSAVMNGTSWEGVDLALRRQADTPWFASFLGFQPANAIARVRQPLLIVQGTLDRQVPEHHAEKLAEMARARKKGRGVEVVTIPGVNHLFVPATTGDMSEYAQLPEKTITPALADAILKWLGAPIGPRG